MKIPKKRILFDNSFRLEYFNEAKDYLTELYKEDFPDDEEFQPSDSDIMELLKFREEIDYQDFINEMTNFIDGNTFIIQGVIKAWDGKFKGGFIFDNINKLSEVWEKCDEIMIYDENGHLYIECSHHDGTNHYEIKMLNAKGERYYSDHYLDEDSKLHDRLMKPPYSVLPNYAHKVWGCKKREGVEQEWKHYRKSASI